MLHTFLGELLFVLAMLGGLALAGGFVLAPLRQYVRYIALAAPLAGLLCIVLGSAALYVVTRWSLGRSAATAACTCIAATLVQFYVSGIGAVRWRIWLGLGITALLVAGLATWSADAATIHLHRPAMLYMDGTDHLGYAHLADWIIQHPITEMPGPMSRMSPDSPQSVYTAWPSLLLHEDLRFGSFISLAIFALVRHRSATFVYDVACATILAAGILAVAGAFARSPRSLLVLIAGLLACHWLDYSRTGYFGKLLSYPSALMLVGFLVSLPGSASPVALCFLGALAGAAALMHPSVLTALFLCVGIGPYLLARLALARSDLAEMSLRQTGNLAAIGGLLIGIIVVASGLLARPLTVAPPDWGVGWNFVLPRALDLESQGATVTGWGPMGLRYAAGVGFAVWIALLALAVLRRDPAAIALLLGPLLLLGGLFASGGQAAAFQLIGFFYPMSLCGAARLADPWTCAAPRRAALGKTMLAASALLISAMVGLRVPRYFGALHRFAGKGMIPSQQFTLRDANRLGAKIGQEPVEVDITAPTQAIFVLVELGRRGVHLQWTPRSWNTVVHFTGWPPPNYPPARFLLVLRGTSESADRPVVCRTRQFDLIDLAAGGAGAYRRR